MPFTGFAVAVPPSVAPEGFTPRASVTGFAAVVTTWPDASCSATWTAGVIGCPAVVVVGWTWNARRVGSGGGEGPLSSPPQADRESATAPSAMTSRMASSRSRPERSSLFFEVGRAYGAEREASRDGLAPQERKAIFRRNHFGRRAPNPRRRRAQRTPVR